jgi:hypothetical protein
MQRWFFGEPQGHGFGRAPINVYGKLFMPRAAVFNVAVHGLACISADQLQMIKTRIVALSKRHCPSDTVGIKTYETMIAQVTGDPELATVYLDIATPGSGLVSDDCGDILPDCDVLPVLGTINIPSAAC